MARAPVEPGEPIKSLKTAPFPIALVIAAWIPPRARTVKHFECPNSVTLVYYLGTCLAAERCAAVPHRAMPAACCGCPGGQTPDQRSHRVVAPICHAGSRKHGPRHHEQWSKRLPHGISLLATRPAGHARSEAAASWWSRCWAILERPMGWPWAEDVRPSRRTGRAVASSQQPSTAARRGAAPAPRLAPNHAC